MINKLNTIFLVILFTTIHNLVYGGDALYIETLPKTSFTIGAVRQVTAPGFQDVTNTNQAILRNGIVRLVYGRESHTDVSGVYWGYEVVVAVRYKTNNTTTITKVDTLRLEHLANTGTYEAIAHYANPYEGDLRAEILSIRARNGSGSWTNSPATLAIVPDDIRLEVQLAETRYYYLNSTSTASVSHNYQYSTTSGSQKSYIDLYWSYVSGMESVEIEYVFWDSLDVDTPPTNNLRKLFANATRVETNNTSYRVELNYPGGKFFYRVRPLGRFIRNVAEDYTNIQYGAWSSVGNQAVTAFEKNKHWSYSVAFAEEGIRKKVITYFDESGHSRQAITYLDDIQRTLVGETEYSIEGQQIVSILPVPTNPQDNNLFFKPKFNQNTSGDAYGFRDYDKPLGADPVKTSSGAGQYYSSDNANTSDIHWGYIPDAGGFPFSQVRYMRDNTGRVAAAGGVGEFYQLGSQHETKIFYATPSSKDLQRLFGSNVGNPSHYEKNIVVDANGQVSIAYLDMTGRTIATALAGATPSNVVSLTSQGSGTTTENLIPLNQNTPNSRCLQHSIANVILNNTASFHYDLVGTYNSLSLDSSSVCVGCEYLLTISIREETTGKSLLPTTFSGASLDTIITGTDTLYQLQHRYTGATLSSCSIGTAYANTDISFDILMANIGTYRISKCLTLQTPAAALSLHLLDSLGVLPDSSAWIASSLTHIDTLQCTFFGDMTEEEYEAFIVQAQTFECYSKLEQIKQQVSPGGAFYPMSAIDSLACGNALTFVTQDVNGVYYQVSRTGGTSILLQTLTGGSVSASSIQLLNSHTGDTTLASNWSQFMSLVRDSNYFQTQWADTLAKCHREYCLYEDCIALISSDTFDARLMMWDSWRDAVDNGWASSEGNYAEIMANDPILQNPALDRLTDCGTLSTTFGNALANFRNSGLDVWQYTTQLINDLETQQYGGSMPSNTRDSLEWTYFRGFYMSVKDSLKWNCTACYRYDDINTIFQAPATAGLATPEDFQNYSAEQMAEHCQDMCVSQVNHWMHQFGHLLDSCNRHWSATDSSIIRSQLAQYCAESCGYENPFAYMLTEDVSNPHLLYALGILSDSVSSPCGVDVMTLLTERDSVYTWATDSSGIMWADVVQYSTHMCAEDFIDLLNREFLGIVTNCSSNPTNQTVDSTNWAGTCMHGITSIQVLNDSDPDVPNRLQLNFSGRGCAKMEFVWLDTLPESPCISACYSPLSTISLCDYDSIRFLQELPDTTTNCLNIPLWQVALLDSITWDTVYLTQCNYTTAACFVNRTQHTRVAIPHIRYTPQSISWDTLTQTCINMQIALLTEQAMNDYHHHIDSLLTVYQNAYVQNCWNSPFAETFTVTYNNSEYHHTLYYYDQAGNLVQTVPPLGVHLVDETAFDINGNWDQVTEPAHTMLSNYQYNSIGQLNQQSTPDRGLTVFYYDNVQRLRLSQNAQQNSDGNYSFTAFDNLSRIERVGQLEGYTETPGSSQFIKDLNTQTFPLATGGGYTLTQVTQTTYGQPTYSNPNFPQENLRGRVATIYNENQTSYYSYDIMGNVATIYQDVTNFKSFKIEYSYDLVSGKVNQVAYQAGQLDALHHRFEYDADLRLKTAYTATAAYKHSTNASYNLLNPTRDTRYFYYTHGPLARLELGEGIAGNDYRYTLQGALVGVNMLAGEASNITIKDPGTDGTGNLNTWFAQDEFAYTLGYYQGDYTPIGSSVNLGTTQTPWSEMTTDILAGHTSEYGLYNGNIAFMLTQIPELGRQSLGDGTQGEAFQYDQLHRLLQSVDYEHDGSNWLAKGDFISNYSYDANGNFNVINRIANGTPIDNIDFSYNVYTNQLNHLDDGYGSSVGDVGNQSNDNYVYDEIGQLIKDDSAYIDVIKWNIQGKVTQVQFTNGSPTVNYTYDALGNRLTKEIDGGTLTYYIRDAAGSLMSIYENGGGGSMYCVEQTVSGGMRKPNIKIMAADTVILPSDTLRLYYDKRGYKTYEQSNHLGNVLVTLSDKAFGIDANTDSVAEYYQSRVLKGSLYYPYGWEMPNRSYIAENHRFSYNGMEASPELGTGHNTTFFRELDTRIARWWSPDPIDFPWQSPYCTMDGNPIALSDVSGASAGDGDNTGGGGNDESNQLSSGASLSKEEPNSGGNGGSTSNASAKAKKGGGFSIVGDNSDLGKTPNYKSQTAFQATHTKIESTFKYFSSKDYTDKPFTIEQFSAEVKRVDNKLLYDNYTNAITKKGYKVRFLDKEKDKEIPSNTDFRNKIIYINSFQTVEKGLEDFVFELTNANNEGERLTLNSMAEEGKISAEQFADAIIKMEAKAHLNAIIFKFQEYNYDPETDRNLLEETKNALRGGTTEQMLEALSKQPFFVKGATAKEIYKAQYYYIKVCVPCENLLNVRK